MANIKILSTSSKHRS